MATLTVLEVLYIVLIAFISIIGTLLSIVLYKVIKILWPIMEIVQTYNKVRGVIDLYASIPWIVIEWVKDTIGSVIKWK